MATFNGQEFNQSTDTWTSLDQDDLASADYAEWNQSTDSWLYGDVRIVWNGSDQSGSGSITVAAWIPTVDRVYTVPEENRTYTVPEENRTYTVPEEA